MKRIHFFLFFTTVGLWGCKVALDEPHTPISLSIEGQESSKVDALVVGDEVAVFARIEGTESYFLEAQKFVTGSDGRTLSTSPASYYPETKQAVNFYAYFPYHTSMFSVPSDQSTPAALKQADLCWAAAKSTPVPAPISLAFQHVFARLVVTTNEPTAKIACQVVSSGVLNAATAEFTLGSSKSEVSTTGNELILPAQPLSRLVLTVSGVEYIFDQNITLEAGKTTSLNLTLNSSTHTATLNGSNVTAWSAALKSDEPDLAVSNQLTAHWLVADYRFNQINQIALTIKDQTTNTTKDYPTTGVTLVAGSTMAAASYTFTLANVPDLHYPYTVTAIKFSKDATLVHTATVSHNIVRPGAVVLGWGQSISLTLSAATASVAATATSSTFTLTSNVPYTSSYTKGGGSVQGTGAQPPYTNHSVTFTYPAQGVSAAAARKHVMTITPTQDYTGTPNKRTFTVTQAAVPCAMTLNSYGPPGVFVPANGNTYTTNLSCNTSWKALPDQVNMMSITPAQGTGNASVSTTISTNPSVTSRTASWTASTTNTLGLSDVGATWTFTQYGQPCRVSLNTNRLIVTPNTPDRRIYYFTITHNNGYYIKNVLDVYNAVYSIAPPSHSKPGVTTVAIELHPVPNLGLCVRLTVEAVSATGTQEVQSAILEVSTY